MNRHERHPNTQNPEVEPGREALVDPPRVYVASLSDYNHGILHGAWINANQPVDTIWDQINNMLARSSCVVAEEWAIHDHDGFGPLRLSEFETIDTIARLGAGIAEHGDAFAYWAAIAGTDTDGLDGFDDAYLGSWDTEQAYTELLIDDLGIEHALDNADIPLRSYVSIDIDMLTRDLNHDHHFAHHQHGVHVFRT